MRTAKLIIILIAAVCADYCNNGWQKQGGPIKPSRDLPEPQEDLACQGRYHELWCCAQGFTNIKWYYSKNAAAHSPWKLVSDEFKADYKIDLVTRNSTLALLYPYKDVHTGDYRCVATNSNTNGLYRHDLFLKIDECVSGEVVPTVRPQKEYLALIDQTVIMHCEADFGSPLVDHRIEWQIFFNKTYLKATDYGGHKEMIYSKDNNRTQQAVLTVTNVQEKNFAYVYRCYMTDFDYDDVQVINTTIKYGDPEDPDGMKYFLNRTIYIIAGCAAFVIVTLSISITFYCKYRLDIRLWWKDRQSRSNKCDDNKEFDAVIIYNEDDEPDEKFVEKMHGKLKDLGYEVCSSRANFEAGRSNVDCYIGSIQNSRRVIIVASPAMLNCNWCKFSFRDAMEEYCQVIIVLFKNITDKEWRQQKKTDSECIKKAMKVVRTIRWPDSDSQNETFWKKLRLELPVLPKKVKSVEPETRRNEPNSSTSSGRPLLSSNLENNRESVISSKSKSSEFSSENCSDDVFPEEKPGEKFRGNTILSQDSGYSGISPPPNIDQKELWSDHEAIIVQVC